MPGSALAFEEVTRRFGRRNGVTALDNVSWSVDIGARACLLGPNGAGKSTSIRLLQGAIRPTAGRVSLLGAVVVSPGYLDARRLTGIVPQGPGMYPDVTAAEFLQLAQRLYGGENMARVVEVFGLGDQLGKVLTQLSGGYQRRLVLASALLGEPELLLLDEPTVGLDPVSMRDVHAFLRRIMPGRTVLLCTHNLAEAEALCESAIILRQGRVVLHERISDLRQRVPSVLSLRAAQGPERLLAALKELGSPGRQDEESVLVPVPEPTTQAPELLRRLLALGVDVYECRVVTPSLEQLFLDIVGATDARA
jgi:ABC-2 type transport system ATP-binding protein